MALTSLITRHDYVGNCAGFVLVESCRLFGLQVKATKSYFNPVSIGMRTKYFFSQLHANGLCYERTKELKLSDKYLLLVIFSTGKRGHIDFVTEIGNSVSVTATGRLFFNDKVKFLIKVWK